MSEAFGYLLVHFVEDPGSHAEKIYLSLSEGDNPTAWRRLNHGAAVLESVQGTGGVRDPHLVRGPHGFHIIATDLRVWRPEGPDWWEFRHRGSRDVVIWDSPSLLDWSAPRYVTLAAEGTGMVWAPKTVRDPATGDFLLFFSAGLAENGIPDGTPDGGTGPSQILMTRTRDFISFTEAEPYFSLPGGVIDMALLVTESGVHRFAKHDDAAPDSLHVFHQRGSSLFARDFMTVARGIGQEIAPNMEGPLIFRHNHEPRWYLWVDQYSSMPHGYHAYTSTDLDADVWEPVPDFILPENTKHGSVLPLLADEYRALDARYPR